MSSDGDVLTLKLTSLGSKASELAVSHRVATLLEGSEVVSIQLTEIDDKKEAVVQVKTPLCFQDAKMLLQKSRINGRRVRVKEYDHDNGHNGGVNENGHNGVVNDNGNRQPRPRSTSNRNKKSNRSETWDDAMELADCFHLHVIASDELLERVAEREEMGIVFQAFLSDISSSDRSQRECRQLEAKVMALLRQKRLLKSRRVGEKVFMTLARMGGPGDFPPQEMVQTERERALARMADAEQNKEGVEVTVASFDDEIVGIRESMTLPFLVASADPSTVLQDIQIGGARGRAFSVREVLSVDMEKLPFMLGTHEYLIEIIFLPHNIGVYRCPIRFTFQTKDKKAFEIVRHIKAKCGDANLEEILKPVAPYTPRQKKYFDKDKAPVDEVFQPPEQPKNGTNTENNPFVKLPQYKIRSDIRQLLVNNELGNILDKPETSLDTYADFWCNIIYASEFQTHQDIKLFEMEQARLKKEGHYFVLTVVGLAEGRPSVLRGDIVNITWNSKLYRACVHKTRLLDVLLELHEGFQRSFNPALDSVDVRFTISRTTFRTSHNGILQAPETMGDTMLLPSFAHVEECLEANRGREVPPTLNFANRSLNLEQQSAIVNIIRGACRPLPNIVWGPPGTGKSTTIVETVYQLARHASKPNILLVAPSNDATDLLVEKLSSYFPPSEMRRLLAFSRSLEHLSAAVVPYAREGLSSEELAQEASSAQIIVCTVNLAARLATFGVPRGFFEVLCVDEAGHATEPEVVAVASTLMDFQRKDDRVGQLILAGDPKQLGPIVTSELCRRFGLEVSYMERLVNRQVYDTDSSNHFPAPLITKLLHNYRSHPSILKLPNDMFYQGELLAAGDPLKTHDMTRWEYLPNSKFPLLFHAMHGENLREGNSPSWFNPQEAQEVVNYVDALVHQSRPPVAQEDIGVITPYARQAQKIRLALASRNLTDIKVGSVETFQGQERRCVIVSTVRTETELIQSDLKYNLGFIANSKRFNVAVTRASSLLVVIGDPNVLAADKKNWLPFLRYCKENSAWAGEPWEDTGDQVLDVGDFEDATGGAEEELGPSARVAQEGIGFINREE